MSYERYEDHGVLSSINPYNTDGIGLAEHINKMSQKINTLKEELAEIWLLADIEQFNDSYKMDYQQYSQLPGKIRL